MAWRSLATRRGVELHSVRFDVHVDTLEDMAACRWLCFGVFDSETQDVEELAEGVEGTVRVLGVLDAVEVHIVSPTRSRRSILVRSCRASATRLKFHTEAAAPKHMAISNHSVKPCSV